MIRKLNLSVEPIWEEIDRVREASTDFLMENGCEPEVIDAVTMVACELTENAAKYGAFVERKTIEVMVSAGVDTIIVEVKNPVAPGNSDDLVRLDEIIQWIRGFQDPFEAYMERLKEVSVQSLESEESGLGLVRIAYEGQAILDFYVNEEDVLAVSAVHQIGAV